MRSRKNNTLHQRLYRKRMSLLRVSLLKRGVPRHIWLLVDKQGRFRLLPVSKSEPTRKEFDEYEAMGTQVVRYRMSPSDTKEIAEARVKKEKR